MRQWEIGAKPTQFYDAYAKHLYQSPFPSLTDSLHHTLFRTKVKAIPRKAISEKNVNRHFKVCYLIFGGEATSCKNEVISGL